MDPVNPLPGSSSRVTRPSASVDTPNHSPSAADVFQLALSVQPEPPERLEGRAIRPGPPLGGGLGGQARPETAGGQQERRRSAPTVPSGHVGGIVHQFSGHRATRAPAGHTGLGRRLPSRPAAAALSKSWSRPR